MHLLSTSKWTCMKQIVAHFSHLDKLMSFFFFVKAEITAVFILDGALANNLQSVCLFFSCVHVYI